MPSAHLNTDQRSHRIKSNSSYCWRTAVTCSIACSVRLRAPAMRNHVQSPKSAVLSSLGLCTCSLFRAQQSCTPPPSFAWLISVTQRSIRATSSVTSVSVCRGWTGSCPYSSDPPHQSTITLRCPAPFIPPSSPLVLRAPRGQGLCHHYLSQGQAQDLTIHDVH